MASVIIAITFSCFLTDKERDYNPQDYFRMKIKEEISFCLFAVKGPARSQKLCAGIMRKLKIERLVDCEEKKIKIYIRHSQKNLRHYFESFSEAYFGLS